ncbi:MAG TPA: translocation/assembly module TamB domain-containing protein, partial [Burkholderiaceae bacterium]|nr:translocation/assembly module TamB domain-containing protein [Burkholderiaceae bacterium]
SGIDASTLHTRSVATDLAGTLDYSLREGEQRFSGSARNSRGLALSAELEATLRQQVLAIERARLRLGEGSADVQGRVELGGARTLRLSGRFGALDLAQIARGIDTRLNGAFEIDGRLAPQPSGRARFELADSRIAGRAVTGQGRVDLADRRFDTDIDVRSGEAHLSAVGGMGVGRELRVEADVPDLSTLLPDIAGHLQSQLTFAGELDAIRVSGTIAAEKLRLPGGHRVESVNASLRGGMQPGDPLMVAVDLSGHSGPGGPERSLAAASLVGRGSMSDARFDLAATTGAQQPVRVSVTGGWRDRAWRGVLQSAEAGAPFALTLRAPAPFAIALHEVSFGPAEFDLMGAHFSEFAIARAEGRWRYSGRFDGLQPQALDARARAPRRVVRSGAGDRVPLTLAGRWDLGFTDSISGIAVIERTGGDLYSGIDAFNPIGISDVGAALNVLANRVTGNVYVRGRALGSIDAAVDAYVDPALSGGKVLAQDRPFRIVLDADLPDLSWIGPLIGDSVQFAGRGSISATVAGTPADPTSTGTMRGESLRLAWVDQAVRLENGRLDAVLDDGVLVINELKFAGTPRVAPTDKRALEGLVSDKPFDVRAVGRFALSSLTGSVGVKATQLPVLQRADRWMVVSGDAGITLMPERAELYAKLVVDGAYVNFTSLRASRALPTDVVVRRPGDEQKTAARAPVDVTLDVQGDLGRRFYIEGAGLEARLEGAVNVTGRPAQLRAEGSVRAVDGIYTGYGQRLQIQRGIVTFQGPIDNPALNVLAVRGGLPVEVGVALSGTAQRPIVRLYSDPSMSDTEKLNWLVLGRPPGAGDSNDRAMLSAAASALFAGQTDSATSSLMRSLGIDQISLQPGQSSSSLLPRETVAGRLRSNGVSTSSSAAADFLTVGKRINDDLFLSFEQALSGAEYFVALNYRLTRQLSVIARAGSTNSLDLVYSLAFE